MDNSTVNMRFTMRSHWLIGVAIGAAMLLSGALVTDALAGSGKKSAEETESRSAGDVVSDTWITTKVKSSLLADSEVSGLDISVETREKVVYLSGEVENQSQVNHAVEIADDIEGVKRVDATSLRIATAVDQVREAVGMKKD